MAEKSSANEAAASAPTRVAILGAGIGGTSAAYFLRQKLPNAEIDILEMDKGTVPYLIIFERLNPERPVFKIRMRSRIRA